MDIQSAKRMNKKININAIVRFRPSDEFKFAYFTRHNHDIMLNNDGLAEFSLWQIIGCADIFAGHEPFEDGYLYIEEKDIVDEDYGNENVGKLLSEILAAKHGEK